MEGAFERQAKLWMAWSVKTFEKANSFSSLDKAGHELLELKQAVVYSLDKKWVLYEYVDVMMCLLHSAAQEGFTIEQITEAFKEKAAINFEREWILDKSGNTYSHKKK
ncbi:MAG: dATP/dGTP pyrophosphohydrolase domain-containing protein [Chitinophagaceae bacterium]